MQTLAAAAVLAGRKMVLVVPTHLRREPGNIIAPAGQNLAYDGINTVTHMHYSTDSEPDWLHRFSLRGQHDTIMQQCPAAGQSFFRRAPGKFRMIVLFRKMCQHYIGCMPITVRS